MVKALSLEQELANEGTKTHTGVPTELSITPENSKITTLEWPPKLVYTGDVDDDQNYFIDESYEVSPSTSVYGEDGDDDINYRPCITNMEPLGSDQTDSSSQKQVSAISTTTIFHILNYRFNIIL